MGKVVTYASVSVDGFVADEQDRPGPLFEWLTSGEVPFGRERRGHGRAGDTLETLPRSPA